MWIEQRSCNSPQRSVQQDHWPYCFHVLFQKNPKTFPVGVPFLSYTRPYFMKIIFQSKKITHFFGGSSNINLKKNIWIDLAYIYQQTTTYNKNCLHLKFSYYWPLQYTLQGFFKMTSDFRSHFCGYCKCSLSKNDNNNLVQKCPFVL